MRTHTTIQTVGISALSDCWWQWATATGVTPVSRAACHRTAIRRVTGIERAGCRAMIQARWLVASMLLPNTQDAQSVPIRQRREVIDAVAPHLQFAQRLESRQR